MTFTIGSRVSLTVRNGTHYTPEPGTTTRYGTIIELNVPNPPARGCTTRVLWDGDRHYNPRIGHAAPDYLAHVHTRTHHDPHEEFTV